MTWPPAHALKEIVEVVISTDDPTLCDRAYEALGALLAEHAGNT